MTAPGFACPRTNVTVNCHRSPEDGRYFLES